MSTRLGSRAPPELGELLHGRTGGNPLFVEESVRHLRELFPAATPEQLVAAATTGVPHGVSTVINRRLVRLADAERSAVTAAAVAGEAFRLDDVVAATELDDDHAAVALDGVVAARLAAGEATAGRYHFAHALIRETVLGGLTATRQALLHRRIADGIERLPADRRESRLPDLARHLLDAHPLVESVAVAQVVLRAAERAIAQLAYEDAAVLLDRALAAARSPGRAARDAAARARRRARPHRAGRRGAALLRGDRAPGARSGRRRAPRPRCAGSRGSGGRDRARAPGGSGAARGGDRRRRRRLAPARDAAGEAGRRAVLQPRAGP